jgi:hypothetical protein
LKKKRIEVRHEEWGFCNPSKHCGKYFYTSIEAGEPIRREYIKKRRPRIPKFKIGQRVQLLNSARIKFDGGRTLLAGTKLDIIDVQKCEKLKGYPIYTLSVTLGHGCPQIATVTKRENRLRGAA